MLQELTPEELTQRPSILDVLPAGLSYENSPQRCSCRAGTADMSAAQKAAHGRVHADWLLLRAAWCDANGYLLADLIVAERARYRLQFDYS
ncbi:MAG TPA: hypothetical protein VEQ66_10830 [Propionibacteriaceae bacterium]|nr:hypothetical protein [Propionibacteriaceae bacterium]